MSGNQTLADWSKTLEEEDYKKYTSFDMKSARDAYLLGALVMKHHESKKRAKQAASTERSHDPQPLDLVNDDLLIAAVEEDG